MIWIIMIGFMILGGIINSRLKNKFHKYSKIANLSNMSGKEIAEKMLTDNGINDVKVISVPGRLTDHYNPIDKTVNLSPDIYQGRSVSALAVASHECGHALQHANSYEWLQMRSQMVPMVSFSNKMMSMIFILGIFGVTFLKVISFYHIIMLFIILQAIVTIFTLITLPVEFDASKRALLWIKKSGISNNNEMTYTADALKWAASTYIVAAIAATTYLLYYISLIKE